MKNDYSWGESSFDSDDASFDPMSNLADIMLVFVAGLLVVIFSSTGVTSKTSGLDTVEVNEESPKIPSRASLSDGLGYQSMGKVYQDPTSGKLYLVKDKNQ